MADGISVDIGQIVGKTIALADEIAPKPKPTRLWTPEDIDGLRNVLATIKDQDIIEKGEFVDAVNRMLKMTLHRIQLPDGRLSLLKYIKPNGPPGYIQFTASGQGTRGRLGKEKISLVKLSEEMLKRGFAT
jgi:hypothetical protein